MAGLKIKPFLPWMPTSVWSIVDPHGYERHWWQRFQKKQWCQGHRWVIYWMSSGKRNSPCEKCSPFNSLTVGWGCEIVCQPLQSLTFWITLSHYTMENILHFKVCQGTLIDTSVSPFLATYLILWQFLWRRGAKQEPQITRVNNDQSKSNQYTMPNWGSKGNNIYYMIFNTWPVILKEIKCIKLQDII